MSLVTWVLPGHRPTRDNPNASIIALWKLSSRNRVTPLSIQDGVSEFSMGSLSRRYRRSLLRYCWFLRSYRRSLRRCLDPWGDRLSPMRRCRSLSNLLNIVRHKTSWTTSKTLWTTSKTSWNTVKTLQNIMKHSPFDATTSLLDAETLALLMGQIWQIGKSTHFREINTFAKTAELVIWGENLWICAVNGEILKNIINIHARFLISMDAVAS